MICISIGYVSVPWTFMKYQFGLAELPEFRIGTVKGCWIGATVLVDMSSVCLVVWISLGPPLPTRPLSQCTSLLHFHTKSLSESRQSKHQHKAAITAWSSQQIRDLQACSHKVHKSLMSKMPLRLHTSMLSCGEALHKFINFKEFHAWRTQSLESNPG